MKKQLEQAWDKAQSAVTVLNAIFKNPTAYFSFTKGGAMFAAFKRVAERRAVESFMLVDLFNNIGWGGRFVPAYQPVKQLDSLDCD